MNKKLIAIAVAAGMAAPLAAANAEVTLYGQLQFEVANVDDGTDSALTVTDEQRGRFGMKASHDLGNGLTGFGVLEYDAGNNSQRGSNDDGSNFGNAPDIREANVGLKGNFGTLTIGTMKQPYKYSGGVTYDPFVTTTLEARGNGGMNGSLFGQNGFWSRSISYISPSLNGFSLWAIVAPEELDTNAETQDGDMQIAAKYKTKTWEVFGVTSTNKDGTATGDTDATKFGGQVKLGPHVISAQMETVEPDGGDEDEFIFLGYQFKIGKNTLVAQLGQRDNDDDTLDTDYLAFGAWHHFTKQVRGFAGYRSSDPDGGDEETSVSVGLRVIF